MKIFLVCFLLTLFGSCSQLVGKLHNQIDHQSGTPVQPGTHNFKNFQQNSDNPYRKNDLRPIQGAQTLKGNLNEQNGQLPLIKRKYRTLSGRFRSDDFLDQGADSASLWSGEGKDNYFLNTELKLKSGDLVIVKVLEELKNQISDELKRSFPREVPVPRERTPGAKNAGPNPAGSQAANSEEQTKIYDKISSKVLDQINDEYVVLKGIKEVLFRARKRFIEIQALVPKKDIQEDKVVLSDKLLETKVKVLK